MTLSWQDQGRQEHGWFGSGTAAAHADEARLLGPEGLGGRIEAAGRGAIVSLPRALRAQGERQLDARSLSRLSEAMTAWSRGGRLDAAQFAERFFGRGADDAVVAQLRAATREVAAATSHEALRGAGERIAGAMQTVGLDRWPGFLADAQARAHDPATAAAVEASQPTARRHGVDAIRPVYPLEYLLSVGAAGVAGGVAGAARSAAGAVLRQVLSGREPLAEDAVSAGAGRKKGADAPSNTDSAGKPAEPTSMSSGENIGARRVKAVPERQVHILSGEADGGGGHRWGTGRPGKSEFPRSWSDDKIIEEIESVANDSNSSSELQGNGRTRITGTRDGIDIDVIVDSDGTNIRTAYPTNTPRNPKAGT